MFLKLLGFWLKMVREWWRALFSEIIMNLLEGPDGIFGSAPLLSKNSVILIDWISIAYMSKVFSFQDMLFMNPIFFDIILLTIS